TVLGTLRSPDHVNNEWVTATLSITGNSLRVQIYRPRTHQYLNASGRWQSAAVWALQRTDSAISGQGQAGVARTPGFAGSLSVDNFAVVYGDNISSSPAVKSRSKGSTTKPTSKKPTTKPTSKKPITKPTSKKPTTKTPLKKPTTKTTSSKPP